MNSILADSSAWIEYDRATASPVDRRMQHLIGTNEPLAVTEPVIMEILAGATSSQRENELRRMFNRFELLQIDAVADFESAARIYRTCRAAGVTPRGLIDCLIAAVAWRRGATLLTQDADLRRIADIVGIKFDRASS